MLVLYLSALLSMFTVPVFGLSISSAPAMLLAGLSTLSASAMFIAS